MIRRIENPFKVVRLDVDHVGELGNVKLFVANFRIARLPIDRVDNFQKVETRFQRVAQPDNLQ